MNRVALVLPSNKWFAPYLNIYTDYFISNKIDFDVIFWDKDGSELDNKHSFKIKMNNRESYIKKMIYYYKFKCFVNKKIKHGGYSKIVIFGSLMSVLLNKTLVGKYKKKFVVDIRDLSVEQRPFIYKIFKKVIANSFVNIVSSPGFIPYLPKGKYILSHNFIFSRLSREDNLINHKEKENDDAINILTIGGIRDYKSNLEVINALKNNKKYKLYFVGKGIAATDLEKYVKDNNINNVTFKGYYEKENEHIYINNSSMLNIYYPVSRVHNTAISNRFYNSIYYNKPMIVTSNSVQGDFVEKYNLGVSVHNCNELDKKIDLFFKELNQNDYKNNCKKLLDQFAKDNTCFYEELKDFLKE